MSSLLHTKLTQEKKLCIIACSIIFMLPFIVWYTTSLSLSQKILDAETIQESCIGLRTLAKEQEQNRTLLNQFQNKEPLYLQRHIESLVPLKKELQELEKDPINSCLPQSREQKNRINFLCSTDSRFSFIEGKVLHTPTMKETLEVQNKTVELDQKDLERVLLLLEGSTIPQEAPLQQILDKRPLLIIETAELERKNRLNHDVWLFKVKLLKRIFGTSLEKKVGDKK